jgi:hypothetical protein
MKLSVVTLLASVVAALAAPARADGDVFAVLPTQGTGGVTAEAELAGSMMRIALQEQSLALVPATTVADAVVANDAACVQSAIACARLVGHDTHASRVVASELWDQGGTLELRLVVVDLRTGLEPGPWQSFTARDKASLGAVAQQAVLSLVVPGAFFGKLTVVAEPGAEVLVDGVARERTPMLAPLQLSVGRHELEVRYGKLAPWRGFVDVAMDKPTTKTLCEKSSSLSEECAPSASASPSASSSAWRGPLLVTGATTAAVGVVGVGVGAVCAGLAGAGLATYASTPDAAQRDAVLGLQGVSVASFIAGGVLLAAGGASALAGWSME